MEAHEYRRDRRTRWRLGKEVSALDTACGDDLLLESHRTSIADPAPWAVADWALIWAPWAALCSRPIGIERKRDLGLSGPLRSPFPGFLAGDDIEPVPGVYGGDTHNQCGQSLLVVVLGCFIEHRVRYRVGLIGQSGPRLGQGQGGALGVGEVRRVPPGGQGERRSSVSPAFFAPRVCISKQTAQPLI